jgi:hypothetical protein
LWAWIQLLSAPEIRAEGIHRRGVEWQLARLAELAPPYRQDASLQVQIVPVETDGLADAHAGHGEQGNQRLVGQDAKRRVQALGRLHQGGDVIIQVQIGHCPVRASGQ